MADGSRQLSDRPEPRVATWKERAVARAIEIELLREALIEIRDSDPVDMALDPGWSARVAREALNGGDQ